LGDDPIDATRTYPDVKSMHGTIRMSQASFVRYTDRCSHEAETASFLARSKCTITDSPVSHARYDRWSFPRYA